MEGLAFYEAAVQILPVLLVVIAVEGRVLENPGPNWARAILIGMFVWIVAAELLALYVLIDAERASVRKEVIISNAIGLELGLILVLAVLRVLPGHSRE